MAVHMTANERILQLREGYLRVEGVTEERTMNNQEELFAGLSVSTDFQTCITKRITRRPQFFYEINL